MKSIKLFLILFIVPLILSDEDSFSIDPFKERLEKEGLLKIIESIKDTYGQDVAIISCEELKRNVCGNCKRLVLEYMPVNKMRAFTRGLPPTIMKISVKEIKSKIKERITSFLKEKFSLEESNSISDNIMKKINLIIIFKIFNKINI